MGDVRMASGKIVKKSDLRMWTSFMLKGFPIPEDLKEDVVATLRGILKDDDSPKFQLDAAEKIIRMADHNLQIAAVNMQQDPTNRIDLQQENKKLSVSQQKQLHGLLTSFDGEVISVSLDSEKDAQKAKTELESELSSNARVDGVLRRPKAD